jgi:hypothetical protein
MQAAPGSSFYSGKSKGASGLRRLLFLFLYFEFIWDLDIGTYPIALYKSRPGRGSSVSSIPRKSAAQFPPLWG